jgi:hypothetical protein
MITPNVAPMTSEPKFCPVIKKDMPTPTEVYRRLEARITRVDGKATFLMKL